MQRRISNNPISSQPSSDPVASTAPEILRPGNDRVSSYVTLYPEEVSSYAILHSDERIEDISEVEEKLQVILGNENGLGRDGVETRTEINSNVGREESFCQK